MFRLLLLSLLQFTSGDYFPGHRLDALILHTFRNIGPRSCGKECAVHGGCHSVNYNVQTFVCDLLYHNVTEEKNKIPNDDYVHMTKAYCNSLVVSCPNSCNLTCEVNQKCVLLESNQPTCITTGCKHPSSIPNITPLDVSMEFDKKYWFNCITPTPSKQFFTCNITGQWVEKYSECQCWYGHYSTGSSCMPCPAGTYLPTVGKSGSSSCISCPAGKYTSSAGSKSAASCPQGQYQNQVRQTRCNACQSGHYSNSNGTTSCHRCAEGTYAANQGQSSCSKCQPGQFSGSGASSCQPCPPGSFNIIEGSKNCTLCPKLQYQDQEGSTSCKHCTTALAEGASVCILTLPID